MSTVGQPMAMLFGGPIASRTVSPWRHAGRLLMTTVFEPLITTPGPCGGIGKGVAHMWISAPPAAAEICAPIAAPAAVFAASSAALAAGKPGVPAAATVAACATLMVLSDMALEACNA